MLRVLQSNVTLSCRQTVSSCNPSYVYTSKRTFLKHQRLAYEQELLRTLNKSSSRQRQGLIGIDDAKGLSSVNKHDQLKVAVIGGGNWGTAVARRLGFNIIKLDSPNIDSTVNQWVFEEQIRGKNLTEIINTQRENVKYLPSIYLPHNITAVPDLLSAIQGANILCFVLPHIYLNGILKQLKGHITSDTIAVSFIKGVNSKFDDKGQVIIERYSEIIQNALGLDNVAVAMGANLASDIAHDSFAETTIASSNIDIAKLIAYLFHCDTFRAQTTDDISTVELCGALKNIVALGAGICDGLELGFSTKAAVIRQGLEEMSLFCKVFDTTGRYKPETLFKSCGVADVIATSYGGRNRLCAEEFTTRYLLQYERQTEEVGSTETLRALWEEIEKDLLKGQKLEGVSACKEAVALLESSGYLKERPSDFPLFRSIHRIVVNGESYEELFNWEYY